MSMRCWNRGNMGPILSQTVNVITDVGKKGEIYLTLLIINIVKS